MPNSDNLMARLPDRPSQAFLLAKEESVLKIAIVEDNPQERDLLQTHLSHYQDEKKELLEIKCFESGFAFLDSFKPIYDIIFLDIAMPGINGMDTARQIRENNSDVTIIFTTSLAQYAIEGYAVEALDFLVKPIEYEPLCRALGKASARLASRGANEEIVIKVPPQGFVRLSSRDVVYVLAEEHLLAYVTMEKRYETWGSLKNALSELPEKRFYRLGRSYIINLGCVKSLQKDSLLMKNGDLIPFPKAGRSQFIQAMDDYLSQ